MHIISGKEKKLHVANNNVIYFASVQISSPIMTVNLNTLSISNFSSNRWMKLKKKVL
jgi:hypothetical protein